VLLAAALASLLAAYLASGGRGRPLRQLLLPSSPVRAVLLSLLLGDLARLGIARLLQAARDAGRIPYAGWERAAFHAGQALTLLWPFGVLYAAVHYYTPGDASAAVGVAYLLAVLNAARSYPELRGGALVDYYRAGQVACAVGCAVAIASPKPRRWRATADHLAVALLFAGLTAELAGPYLYRTSFPWWTTQVSWTLTFAAIIAARIGGGRWLRNPSSPSS
jgi:hypothetical protein